MQTLIATSIILMLPPLHVQVSPCTIAAALNSRRLSLSVYTYVDAHNLNKP
jgi:hypothetical protein